MKSVSSVPTTRLPTMSDRGGDAWYVLDEAVKRGWWLTVRSSSDRRLEVGAEGQARTVREALAATRRLTVSKRDLTHPDLAGPGCSPMAG